MIYARLGENDKAGDYLRRAIGLNPQFHPLHADLARATLQSLAKDTVTQAGLRAVDARQ
jgi:Tfp pilus assembly protein PilF